MKIILATDHAGFELKEKIKDYLSQNNYEIVDVGAFSYEENDDYPPYMHKAAELVAQSDNIDRAIIFGGSGQGEAMVANKVKGVRAALWYGGNMDIIKLSREHNDANVLSIGARFVTFEEAKDAVNMWLKTDFSNELKHKRRIENI